MKTYLRGFGFSNFGIDARAHLPSRQESNWVSFFDLKSTSLTLSLLGLLIPEGLWVQQLRRKKEEIFPMAKHLFKSGYLKYPSQNVN